MTRLRFTSKGLKSFSWVTLGLILACTLEVLITRFAWGSMAVTSPTLTTIAQASSAETEIVTSQVNLFQAAFLGFVQGMTEFLPISSTAHLKAVPVALGWGDPGVTYTAVIQLGSIVAVVWYFWQDLSDITLGAIQAIKKSDYEATDFRLALGIALGTLPIVIFGLMIKLFVPNFDNSPLRSMTAIAIASIVMALLLGLAELVGKRRQSFENLRMEEGIFMGLAQALALIPGVSRSGSTITAGLFIGLKRETAARFSFLLGIPAITLAGLVEFVDVFQAGVSSDQFLSIIVAIISAAFFSYLAIDWLIRYLKKQNTWIFVWYRLLFGIVILVALSQGWL